MKSLYGFILFSLGFCGSLHAVCITSADYSTTNNFCDLDSLYLTANPLNGTAPFTFLWETGETTQTISIPLAFADYLVTITDADGCSIVINCHIKPFPQVLYYPFNQNGCGGDTVTLFLEWFRDSIPGATYLWSTGETTPTIQIWDDITWSVTVTDPNTGCEFIIPPSFFDFHPTGFPEIVGPSVLCDGQTATLSVNGGPFGIIYWLPGGVYAPTYDITGPGTYIVWGSSVEVNYCWHQDTLVIEPGDINPPILTGPPPICNGQTGTINITNSSEYETFLWSGGETTASITVTQGGTYTVTVTNEDGCTSTGEYVVEEGPGPTVSLIPFAATCGENNGSIDLSTSPPGSYTFDWSNGSTTEDLNAITGGLYEVTVTSSNGCTAMASTTVPDNTVAINISETITPNTSCITYNGAIDLSITPNGTYTYLWTNGAVTQDLNNLMPGTYSVTVTMGVNCIASEEYVVPNASNEPVFTNTIIPATCGENNGSIDLQVNSGVPPFTFIWSNGASQENINNVPGGVYSVTVTGSDGCSSTSEIEIPDNPVDIALNGIVSPNTSCNGENGAIDLEPSPIGVYTFAWSNGSTSEDLINIPAGSYTVTVTLGLSCTESETYTVPENTTSITISGNTTPNTSCDQPNGTIDITIIPSDTFSYIWSNGQITEDLQQLTGGTYIITVTGSDGCTATQLFEVLNTSSGYILNGIVFPNTSCGQPNGSIDITITPAGTYNFVWSTGATTEDLQNLNQGSYTLTVTDLNNCSLISVFSLSDTLSYPQITSLTQPAVCGGTNGSIDITVSPPNNNSYVWSNGSTSEDLFNLAAGSYVVEVTGMNNCISSDTITVENQNSNFVLSGLIQENTSCLNPNGGIDLTVSPSGVYSFLWSTGNTSEDLANVAPGTYIVSVTDSLNCSSTGTFLVDDSTTTGVISAIISPANCGLNNGMIDVTILPFNNNTYVWSNGATSEDLMNILPGEYSITVTDGNGCQVLDTFTVTNTNSNFSIASIVVDNSSCSAPNGSIDLTLTPSGVYTFTWSNGSALEDLVGVGPGIYSVTITDNSLCASTFNFVIGTSPPQINIISIITPETCGASNGSIELNVFPANGSTFQWSTGQMTEDIANLTAGTYTVTVIDGSGCSITDTFIIINIGSNANLAAMVTNDTSCILPSGTIDLMVTPSGIYDFMWSTGSITEDLSNLQSGIYTVTVSDVNGCTSSGIFTITSETITPEIQGLIKSTGCGGSNGQIDISINPPGSYFFTWSNGEIVEDINDISSGSYTVTVTNDAGCSAYATFIVSDSSASFIVSGLVSNITSCTLSNGSIDINIYPAGIYTFLWSNGSTTEDLQSLAAGVYILTVTDGSYCTSTSTYTLAEEHTDPVVNENIIPAMCGEETGFIELSVTPSSGNFYQWSNGTSSEDLENVPPGLYSITITGQNGCSWSNNYIVPGSAKMVLALEADIINQGDDSITIRASVNIPFEGLDTLIWLPEDLFNCQWNFCLEQTILNPQQQTEIIVIAIDSNGCMAQSRLFIDNATDPQVFIPNVFSPNTDGINDYFTIYGNKDVEEIIELRIFDRWGNFVFVNDHFPPNQENYGWDGVFRNHTMNPAVYAYWALVRFTDGSEQFYKGDVTLVR
jgi:gliding motility-associated-like protein